MDQKWKTCVAILVPFVGFTEQAVGVSANTVTIQSYESSIQEYTSGTSAVVSGNFKVWIDTLLQNVNRGAEIIEIGSAFGRDAAYIESQGFKVERTDATEGFVHLLHQAGHLAHLFNVVIDDFTKKYDLIFANAVFLHFTPQELQSVLLKAYDALKDNGILAFSVKKGEGEEWTTAKLGQPRYFCYWDMDKMKSLLSSVGFDEVTILEDDKWLQIIAKRG